MNWLAWRQHRKQFMVAGIFLVLFAAFMIPAGLHFWHTYQHALSTCGSTDTCNQLNGELFQSSSDNLLFHLPSLAILFLPILLGLFWGVPFLAKEYAEGTNKLVWTQGVSRRKWLTVKFIWVLIGTAVIAGAFTALNTWFSQTNNALYLNRFDTTLFDSQGIVPIGYAIFAVALGSAFGALFRRTMVALGVTLFLLIAIVLIIVPNFVRPHYETPLNYKMSLLRNIGSNGPTPVDNGPASGAALVLDQGLPVNSKDQSLNFSNPPKQCIVAIPNSGVGPIGGHKIAIASEQKPLISQNGGPAISVDCLNTLGYKMEIKYQPSYRYWDFQRIETRLYLALSIIPIGATYWLVLKRDA